MSLAQPITVPASLADLRQRVAAIERRPAALHGEVERSRWLLGVGPVDQGLPAAGLDPHGLHEIAGQQEGDTVAAMGFALALASDVRIATPRMRMNAAFIRIGLSACDIGVSYFLPRMVGSSVAAEYMLTGRFIDAERAYQLGLISRVVAKDQLQAEAQAFALDMLHATPLGLRLTKEALNHAIDAQGLEAVIAMEDRNQILASSDGDFQEGVQAFLEKRKPNYSKRDS